MDDLDVRPVVVAPTYNNAGTLGDILARIEALRLPIIVVDDGSTDDTAALLASWSASDRATPRTTISRRPSTLSKR